MEVECIIQGAQGLSREKHISAPGSSLDSSLRAYTSFQHINVTSSCRSESGPQSRSLQHAKRSTTYPHYLLLKVHPEKKSHHSAMTKKNIISSMKYNCISMGIKLLGFSKIEEGRASVKWSGKPQGEQK